MRSKRGRTLTSQYEPGIAVLSNLSNDIYWLKNVTKIEEILCDTDSLNLPQHHKTHSHSYPAIHLQLQPFPRNWTHLCGRCNVHGLFSWMATLTHIIGSPHQQLTSIIEVLRSETCGKTVACWIILKEISPKIVVGILLDWLMVSGKIVLKTNYVILL